jgi:hypothetical protein
MKRSIVAGSIALAAAALCAVGCGEQRVERDAKRAENTVAKEAEELGSAAREGAAARTARDLEAAEGVAAEAIDQKGIAGAAGQAADDVADTARANVEESTRTAEETYDAARKSGEGVVDAAGDAENAVLAIPDEKEAKQKGTP